MAYHVSVKIQYGNGSIGLIYHKPIGADDMVFSYWHLAANDLSLPLIAQIYHEGVALSGEQLGYLSSDLQKLEEHWIATGAGTGLRIPHFTIGPDGIPHQAFLWLQEHLLERLGFVREAIRIAKETGGVAEIS